MSRWHDILPEPIARDQDRWEQRHAIYKMFRADVKVREISKRFEMPKDCVIKWISQARVESINGDQSPADRYINHGINLVDFLWLPIGRQLDDSSDYDTVQPLPHEVMRINEHIKKRLREFKIPYDAADDIERKVWRRILEIKNWAAIYSVKQQLQLTDICIQEFDASATEHRYRDWIHL